MTALQSNCQQDSSKILSDGILAVQDVVEMCDDALSALSGMDESSAAVSSYLEVSIDSLIGSMQTYLQLRKIQGIQRSV